MHRTDLRSPSFSSVSWETWVLFLLAGVLIEKMIVERRPYLWAIPFWLGSLIKFRLSTSDEMETPPDARCGSKCSLCISFKNGHCSSCPFGDEHVRASCPIFVCAEEKQTRCTECPEMLHCEIYREYATQCPFESPKVLQDTLPKGCGFLVKENSLNAGLALFLDRIVRGDLGLIVLRQPPEVLAGWPQLETMPVVRLNQTEVHRSCLDPTNLAKLHLTIEEFFEAAPRACVLLEGMEYLMIHNGTDRLLKFIHSIVECAGRHKSRFIAIIDPRVLENEELGKLEREFAAVEVSSHVR